MTKKEITTIYAKNENNLIYKVDFQLDNSNSQYGYLNLTLVCGLDYIDPDYSNTQGYVGAYAFIEDVQTDTLVFYFIEESVKDSLKSGGYEIIEKLPKFFS